MGIRDNKLVKWFNAEDDKTVERLEQRYGSIGSAGGDSPLTGIIPPPINRRASLTVERALGFAPVYRSVEILTTAVSQLPVFMEVGGQKKEDRVPGWLKRPNQADSMRSFVQKSMHSLITTGNAYWFINKKADGSVLSLESLSPLSVSITYDKNNNKRYNYGDQSFRADQIKHLKLGDNWGDYGFGPIQTCARDIEGAIQVRDYSKKWFEEGNMPNGVLSVDGDLNATKIAVIQDGWGDMLENHNTAVLPSSTTYSPIDLNPKDALYIEVMSFNKAEIASLFGIPATLLIAPTEGNMTYQNMQDADLNLFRYTIANYVDCIEEAFSDLLPWGTKARFDNNELLRGNMKARMETYAIAVNAGVMTKDEVRALEGLPPLPKEKPQPINPPTPTQPEGEDNDGTTDQSV